LNCVFLERFHQVHWRFAPDHQDSRQIFNETSIRFRLQKRSDGLAAQFFLGAEPGMFDWILGSEPGSTFVDIGVSNGVWSIFAAAVGGTNCHIFEPNQVRVEQLEQNLRQNELVGKVTVHRFGLADQDGEITLEEPTTDGKREALGLSPKLQRLIRAAIPGRTEIELEYLLRALLLTEKPTTIARRQRAGTQLYQDRHRWKLSRSTSTETRFRFCTTSNPS
jgi:FkbM family methyltransferase